MTEFGFPQLCPAEVKNDNTGTIAKVASDASDKHSLYMKRRVKFIQECERRSRRHLRAISREPCRHPHEAGEHEGDRDAARRDPERAALRREPSRHRGVEYAFVGR